MHPTSREYSRAVGNLRLCRACQEEVSTKAKTCPHCGEPWPVYGVSPFAYGVLEGLGSTIESAKEAMRVFASIVGHLVARIPKLILLLGFSIVIGSGIVEVVSYFSSWSPPSLLSALLVEGILGYLLIVFIRRIKLITFLKRIYRKFAS